jgi:hypothetical protein
MIRLLYVFLVLLTVSSCKTNLVYISVLHPAPVSVRGNAQTAGLLNRAIPDPANARLNELHNALGANTKAITQEGSAQALDGLRNALVENKRFNSIKTIQRPNCYSSVVGAFSPPLSWDEVREICQRDGIDVLFVLEVFDTRLRIPPPPVPVVPQTPGEIINGVVNTQVPITTDIKTGWRIYDPVQNTINDEIYLNNSFTFSAGVLNAPQAVSALMGRKEMIKQTADQLGRNYASRIIPYWQRVSRDYYVKGTPSFRTAMRRARSGNWDGAGELWKSETNHRKRKIAGRACYNMAIISEINGELDEAIKWAQRAYEDYNNRLALGYIRILRNRQAKERVLEFQQ